MTAIIDYVREGKYLEAYQQMEQMRRRQKWNYITTVLDEDSPLLAYSFLLYMVSQDDNEAEWHFYCYMYLVYCNLFFDDAMRLAMWHLKQAISLQPLNSAYKKEVISIGYSYPVKHFTDEEFQRYAADVIAEEPDNKNAKEVLGIVIAPETWRQRWKRLWTY